MNLQDNLLVLLIAFTVWAIIMYLLISSSVRNANKEISYYAKMLYRTQLFKLRKAGHSMEEISALHSNDDNHFWRWLKDSNIPSEEKSYLEELQRIKEAERKK